MADFNSSRASRMDVYEVARVLQDVLNRDDPMTEAQAKEIYNRAALPSISFEELMSAVQRGLTRPPAHASSDEMPGTGMPRRSSPRAALITAVDVGTTKICTLMGQTDLEGRTEIVGVGVVPSRGIRKGVVVGIEDAKQAIRQAITEASNQAGRRPSEVYVAVSLPLIRVATASLSLDLSNPVGSLSRKELADLVHASYPLIAKSEEPLHIVPWKYTLENPAAPQTARVLSQMVIAEGGPLKDLMSAIEASNVRVAGLVSQPLAAGQAVLTEEEKEIGTIVIDIGGGTTDIALFAGGVPQFVSSIPVGGWNFTNDLAIALNLPIETAETLKLVSGTIVPYSGVGQIDSNRISVLNSPEARHLLVSVLSERFKETLGLVLLRLKQGGIAQVPPGGIVFTGGGSSLIGLEEYVSELLDCRVRIGTPIPLLGQRPDTRVPKFAASVGAFLWASAQFTGRHTKKAGDIFDLPSRLLEPLDWIRRLVTK